jgi:T-complex protein 1 subunit beta
MFLNPVQVLKSNASEERGETARLSSFVGAIAIGDLVKTTLGPKGMVCLFYCFSFFERVYNSTFLTNFIVSKLFLFDKYLNILQNYLLLQDKILLSGDGESGSQSVMVTNDGATILKAIGIDNPAAKVLVGECCCLFYNVFFIFVHIFNSFMCVCVLNKYISHRYGNGTGRWSW